MNVHQKSVRNIWLENYASRHIEYSGQTETVLCQHQQQNLQILGRICRIQQVILHHLNLYPGGKKKGGGGILHINLACVISQSSWNTS